MGGAKAEQSEKVLELILASVWVSSRNFCIFVWYDSSGLTQNLYRKKS